MSCRVEHFDFGWGPEHSFRLATTRVLSPNKVAAAALGGTCHRNRRAFLATYPGLLPASILFVPVRTEKASRGKSFRP